MPPAIPESDDALLAECVVETLRASTKGGQRANKVETGVRLTHTPTGIRVTAHRHRSQARNRADAIERLRARLEERARPVAVRKKTTPTRGSKRRRLDAKKRRSATKAQRRWKPVKE